MNNSLRKAAHRERVTKLRDRKRQRKARAEIHAAMEQATAMTKRRTKGCSKDREKNMTTLGWGRIDGNGLLRPRRDVTEKYQKVT
jgi:hypothetical protein